MFLLVEFKIMLLNDFVHAVASMETLVSWLTGGKVQWMFVFGAIRTVGFNYLGDHKSGALIQLARETDFATHLLNDFLANA